MKKTITVILALMLLMGLTGCAELKGKSPGEATNESEQVDDKPSDTATDLSDQEEVSIDFWHSMNGANLEALEKITNDFMSSHPHIKVNLLNQGGYRDLFDKLMAAAKAKQLPHLSQIYSNRLSWYVEKGLALDLKPYIEAEGTGLSEADFEDIPEMFMNDCIWGEGQYCMPFNKSMMVLYYNATMFEEAGIDVPKTWEEWAEAAKALTVDEDKDGEPEIYGMVFANNLSTDIAPWLKQAGGMTMSEETNELFFNTPETKEAVSFINSMFESKSARLAGEDKYPNLPLQQGRAAMCVASTSALPHIEADTMEGITIKAAPLPAHKTNDQLYYGTNVTIFDTGTEAEKQAAWDYLKFLTNSENTAYFAAMTGYIPVRKSAAEVPVFAEALADKEIKKMSLEQMDNGFQGSRNIGGINALDALGDQLDLIFSGEKDIDSALEDAQKNGEKAMDEARNN